MNNNIIDILIIVTPAFFAGVMIAFAHANLGLGVIKRGIIFMDLAIAQIAGFGVLIAQFVPPISIVHNMIIAILPFLFAIAFAIFFGFLEKKYQKYLEAVIGTSFVVISSLSFLVLFKNPAYIENFNNISKGQLLFVTYKDLLFYVPIYTVFTLLSFIDATKKNLLFYILFAIIITMSVNLVGVYMVFATLILPALVALHHKRAFLVSVSFASFNMLISLIIAVIFDFPAGLVDVLSLTTLAIIYFFYRNYFQK